MFCGLGWSFGLPKTRTVKYSTTQCCLGQKSKGLRRGSAPCARKHKGCHWQCSFDQLTARGVMEPSALYEAPFSSLHAGGPEALFAGKSNVIDGIFEKLKALQPEPLADTG